MSPSDATFAELRLAGLPGQLCLSWCQGDDLEEVARRFGADMSSGAWATPDDIEDLEEEHPGQLLQLAPLGDWVIALEPAGFQGVRPEIIGPLSSGGQAFSVSWNIELDSSVCYAADGEIKTSFNLVEVETRYGADPAVLDPVLREVGLHGGLPVETRKARSLALGEKISGRPLTPDWLHSPRFVFTITDPLPDLPVLPSYLSPRPSFLDEPEFTRILSGPAPTAAPAIARMVVSAAAGVAALQGELAEEIMALLDHGERYPGQRQALQALLAEHRDMTWQQAGRLRADATPGRADAALELEVASSATRVLMAALLPDPIEAALAAASQGKYLRLPPAEHERMEVLYKVGCRIEYDLRHS
ncbi:DUF6461 domain-containing protein [Nonomuraea rhodomycinica]|uniref:Uncharacterized protein n=1 Tax=Nonomuraea rhodomycinica TaxID=1712872 RepID=A0A7Y6MBR9_9ACTN|nr:DUF6461 domain-containing protein [Nonomuraea rhodomycinica]NUW41026.1 hypothetical protein [Nonomuraea rhodomycinica]